LDRERCSEAYGWFTQASHAALQVGFMFYA